MSYFEDISIVDDNGRKMQFNSRGHQEVEIASQITPPYVGHFVRNLNGENALTVQAEVEDTTITVDDATGAVVGQSVILTDATNVRFYIGHIIAINALVITLDSPISSVFPIATTVVGYLSHDMNVLGSLASPIVFGARAGEPSSAPLPTVVVDMTRVLSSMLTTTTPTLNQFGNITALTNGCVLRINNGDGTYTNILNIKSNFDLAAVAYDLNIYSVTGQGLDGLSWRLTFGGEEKMGTVIRLDSTQDLEWIVQDDLTGLTTFECIAEGALVAD
jgi:hypothetical protein